MFGYGGQNWISPVVIVQEHSSFVIPNPITECLCRTAGDAIGAASAARDNVFRAFNDCAGAKDRSKEVKFRDTKALASTCRGTNGAVVLYQKDGLVFTSAMYPSSARMRASLCTSSLSGSDRGTRIK